MTRRFRVTIAGVTYQVEVEELGGAAATGTLPPAVTVPAAVAPAALPPAAPAPERAASTAAGARSTDAKEAATARPAAEPTADGEVVRAPLPGTVVAARCGVGQKVAAGEVLVVLEAMKMENDIIAPVSGTVREVLVEKGTAVSLGDAMVVIGPEAP